MVVDGVTNPATVQLAPVYQFLLDFQMISWIPVPLVQACESSSRRQLNITVLYGTEQHEIGTFDIIHDECLIDQQLSCRMTCAKPEDFGKLHVYIDEACSSGLAGHIAVDLKEFSEERDFKVLVEYPVYAANSKYGSRLAKLKMTVQCDSFSQEESPFDLDFDNVIQWSPEQCSVPGPEVPPCDENVVLAEKERKPVVVQNLDPRLEQAEEFCDEPSHEVQLLKDVESILCELNAKLTNVVAPYKLEDRLLGHQEQIRTEKSDCMQAAAFFLTGLSHRLLCQLRKSSLCPLTSSKAGEHILPAGALSMKETAAEFSWPKQCRVTTSMWDTCSAPDDLHRDVCGSSQHTQTDVEAEIRQHLQAGSCADCFLCSMRSSNKYDALLSCFSSSVESSEDTLSSGCDSSVESSSTVDEEQCNASADEPCAAPRRSAALIRTIVGVVLMAGAAVLGFRTRKSRKQRSISGGQLTSPDRPGEE